jgi:xylulokinase
MGLLGIDIGTTNYKICLLEENGEIPFEKTIGTPFIKINAMSFLDVVSLYESMISEIAKMNVLMKQSIVAISVSSFGETVVGIDKNGVPVTKCHFWFDRCTESIYSKYRNLIDDREIYEITGLLPSSLYSLYKLLWAKENDMGNYKKVIKWVSVSGYILFCLSGEYSFDLSLASRTMMLNIAERRWWEKSLELMEVSESKLPKLVESGEIIGALKKSISISIGLPENVKIVAGGHDHLCGAISAGIIKEDVILLTSGTTEAVTVSLDSAPEMSMQQYRKSFCFGVHAAKNKYYGLKGLFSGGYAIDWMLKLMNENYAVFNSMELPQFNLRPIFYPYLLGDYLGNEKAAILNLEANCNKQQLLQAVIISLCFEARKIIEEVESCFRLDASEVYNVGGATKNEYWMKMKAMVLGKTIVVPEDAEGSCRGAAILAGIGSGIFKSEFDAYKKTFRKGKVYRPQLKKSGIISKSYSEYQKAIMEIKKLNGKLETLNV